MTLKLFGAAIILVCCGYLGFRIAKEYRKEISMMRSLSKCIQHMINELQYQLTPLPLLCVHTAGQATGIIHKVFLQLAKELDSQISPDVQRCMDAVLGKCSEIPKFACVVLKMLGQGLGKYDLSGQILALESVNKECNRILEDITQNQTVRLRNYQTLGLCAGAALVILFI